MTELYSSFRGGVVRLALAILICESVGILGALTTSTGQSPWYQQLQKPSFTPPGWVFAPVWTTLYAMMGLAAFLVWRSGIRHRPVRVALALFGTQLLLNAIWTPIFFGQQSLVGGLVVIVLLLIAIVATIAAFWTVSRPAAALLVPYLAWTGYATVLNAALVYLNQYSQRG